MADVSITAANVRPSTDAKVRVVTAGATVTAGQPVYKDTSDSNEWKGCDNDAAASAKCEGIAMTNAADGEGLVILTEGSWTAGGTLTKGTVYFVSGNAGGIAPAADVTSAKYVTPIGVASSTSVMIFKPHVTGVAV